jgi:hypothetical protein
MQARPTPGRVSDSHVSQVSVTVDVNGRDQPRAVKRSRHTARRGLAASAPCKSLTSTKQRAELRLAYIVTWREPVRSMLSRCEFPHEYVLK